MREQRRIDQPQEGFWMIRLTKGGVEVPACIRRIHTRIEPDEPSNVMERSAFLAAFINGRPVAMESVWLVRGRPVTQEEHDYQVADAAWVRKYAPHEAKAEPTRSVNFLTTKPPF